MGNADNTLKKVKDFVDEVSAEMQKTTWPLRDELIESTVVVIVSVVLIAVFVGVSDKILVELLKVIIPAG